MRTLPILAILLALGASSAVNAQTLAEKAGQMIVVGFQGNSAEAGGVRAVRSAIADGRIGGVMFLRTNVASKSAVEAMNEAFLSASKGLPPFLTLDQEGGAVERLTEAVGFKEIPNAATVAATTPPSGVRQIYNAQAKGIAEWGFNVNFAPVVDLNRNAENQIIAKYGRAFGSTPTTVTVYAEQVIAAHHQMGLLTSIKHFPGHGSSTADSHEGYVDITQSWDKVELEPYKTLIDQGYSDFVMIGHLVNTDYSDQPASLSPEWVTGVLRGDLGFKGVVISDDLEMGAIREHYTLRETVKRAVMAGLDVLLFSNTSKYRVGLSDEVLEILLDEAKADPAFKARIEESYGRIVALKSRIGAPGRG